MNKIQNIQNELDALNVQLPICREKAFAVPENYFENLYADVMKKIKSEDDETFSFEKNKSKETFKAPNNYFENFSGQLMQKIKHESVQEELASISPMLANIPKQNIFSVPDNYFNNLHENISSKLENKKPVGKLVSFSNNKFLRIAVAAALVGIVFVWGLRLMNNNETENKIVAPEIAWNEVNVKLDNISDSTLNNFVELEYDIPTINATENANHEVKLNDLSDSELQNFISVTETWSDKAATSFNE